MATLISPKYDGEVFVSMRKCSIEDGTIKLGDRVKPMPSKIGDATNFKLDKNSVYCYSFKVEEESRRMFYYVDENNAATQVKRIKAFNILVGQEEDAAAANNVTATDKWVAAIDKKMGEGGNKVSKDIDTVAKAGKTPIKAPPVKRDSQSVLERKVGIAENRVERMTAEIKDLKAEVARLNRENAKYVTRLNHINDALVEQEANTVNMDAVLSSVEGSVIDVKKYNEAIKRGERKMFREIE